MWKLKIFSNINSFLLLVELKIFEEVTNVWRASHNSLNIPLYSWTGYFNGLLLDINSITKGNVIKVR